MSSKGDPRKAKQDVHSKSKGQVGDWVRHISSSGKEYYYNLNTRASQWEKPRELDYGEEMLAASAIQLSKVSTELKMARSLVRLTDIQVTLQEQRIIFLRELIQKIGESQKDNPGTSGV